MGDLVYLQSSIKNWLWSLLPMHSWKHGRLCLTRIPATHLEWCFIVHTNWIVSVHDHTSESKIRSTQYRYMTCLICQWCHNRFVIANHAVHFNIQWTPSNPPPLGVNQSVLIRGVASFLGGYNFRTPEYRGGHISGVCTLSFHCLLLPMFDGVILLA